MKYVYLLRNGRDYYKVGVVVKVSSRLTTIQTSNPERVSLVACRFVEDAEQVEAEVHRYLHERRADGGGEWFKLTPEQAIEVAIMINNTREIALLDRQVTIESLVVQNHKEYVELRRTLAKLVKKVQPPKQVWEAKAESSPPGDPVEPPLTKEALRVAKRNAELEDLERRAIELFISQGKASASMLQIHLSVGYARAAKLMNRLEEKGIVSPGEGAKPREVFPNAVEQLDAVA